MQQSDQKGLALSIQELIASAGDRLTPTDRRIAEAIIGNPTLLAFGTVSDLADHVGTSRPSIVRFAVKLGFDGYTDLQAQHRDQVSNLLSRPTRAMQRSARGSAYRDQAAFADPAIRPRWIQRTYGPCWLGSTPSWRNQQLKATVMRSPSPGGQGQLF